MITQPMIETKDLTKVYNGNTAVDKLNLRVGEGEIFGFLGPNGAGKTTTILMLLGLTEPTSGMARIADYNSTKEPLKVKRITGYIPEKVGFYEDLTAHYNLAYTARLNGLPEDLVKPRVDEALERVGLLYKADSPVATLSRGMKQRLAIADVLIKAPKVAIMDEPTTGIDPKGINELLDMIEGIAKELKMTIMMSSHQLWQVERICSRVAMLINGRIIVQGSIEELRKEAFSGRQAKIEVQLVETTSAIVDVIKRIDGVVDVEMSGDLLIITAREDLRPQIARAIVENNGLATQMNIQRYGLQDIYLRYFREE